MEARTPQELTARQPVHFIPVDLSYTVFKLGEAPKIVEAERRHMVFTNFSYSAMLKELGVKKTGDGKAMAQEIAAATDSLDEDPIRKSSIMVWAALVTEDPDLTVDEVMKMIDISQFRELILNVVRAMTYFVHGPNAHDEVEKAVKDAEDKVAKQQKVLEDLAEGVDPIDGDEKNG